MRGYTPKFSVGNTYIFVLIQTAQKFLRFGDVRGFPERRIDMGRRCRKPQGVSQQTGEVEMRLKMRVVGGDGLAEVFLGFLGLTRLIEMKAEHVQCVGECRPMCILFNWST
jgi:hypothetical protein